MLDFGKRGDMGACAVGEIVNTEMWIKECVICFWWFVWGDSSVDESCIGVVMWLDHGSADIDPERELVE